MTFSHIKEEDADLINVETNRNAFERRFYF